jgi:hypothetical protein
MFAMLVDVTSEVGTSLSFEPAEQQSEPVVDTEMRGRSLLERQVHRRVKRTVDLL